MPLAARMEDRMDHLMLLGGQFVQARIRNEYEQNRASAAARSRKFWDDVDAVERGVFDAYGFAARLVVGLVVLGVIFGALGVAAPSGNELPATTCLECSATLR
jgi:hypothetical protein